MQIRYLHTTQGLAAALSRSTPIPKYRLHGHMLFLDGVCFVDKYGTSRFHRVKAPTIDELAKLTHTIADRAGRYFERRQN